jgi:hypothetical protein
MSTSTKGRIDIRAITARVLYVQRVYRLLQQHSPVLITGR